ncbi:MAG: SGNH/GDSL hydrolase family protein [Oscillospiraceae bacterium]|nr:SGNH/GDSL hydrolase family protein [Oscillospiraceae bacterium]
MKVTLLGDSIRMIGYGPLVPDLLGDGFEVYQPDDNCRFAKYTLRGLFDWERQMAGSRIVHWNNGLWDFCDLFGDGPFSTEEEYKANMLRIADILLARCEKVIFATTTPVTEQNPHDNNAVIEHYNCLIVPLLEKKGILINDLHATMSRDIDRYIRKDDNIHLTDAGAAVCAKQVSDTILAVAKTMGQP